MQPRRAQTPISIRSDRAAHRLRLLTRDGRSQAAVIEDALDQLPLPERDPAAQKRYDAIMSVLSRVTRTDIPSMEEFDAMEYDEDGNLR